MLHLRPSFNRAGALLVGNTIFLNNRRRQLATLAARHGVPTIGSIRKFVLAGGLMIHGASDTDAYRRAGSHYVASILRGKKPGDLPVEMPNQVRARHQCRDRQGARPRRGGKGARPTR